MIMCHSAGTGVAADTSLVSDIAQGLERSYDRATLKVQFPQVFNHVVPKDAKLQISASLNLVPVELTHKRNVVKQGIGIVFISKTLHGPKDRNLDPINYDNAVTRGAEYADFFENCLNLETSIIDETTKEVVEQTYKEFDDKARKFEEEHFISDETKVGGKAWQELRASAMRSDYTEQAWYTDITDEEKQKLEELRQAQARQNNDHPLVV